MLSGRREGLASNLRVNFPPLPWARTELGSAGKDSLRRKQGQIISISHLANRHLHTMAYRLSDMFMKPAT